VKILIRNHDPDHFEDLKTFMRTLLICPNGVIERNWAVPEPKKFRFGTLGETGENKEDQKGMFFRGKKNG
jgi:hypothetical protein